MDKDIVLWLAGVAIAIILALLGAKVIKSRTTKQRQKTGDNSIAIQSGRDTNLGGEDG
ncbi:MAG: hypothetical protein NUV50_06095 [Rhodospirillales bacterium]|nr:hypothetical protein [Rhodospirillales bacterium]